MVMARGRKEGVMPVRRAFAPGQTGLNGGIQVRKFVIGDGRDKTIQERLEALARLVYSFIKHPWLGMFECPL